jgi:hypothetical protein
VQPKTVNTTSAEAAAALRPIAIVGPASDSVDIGAQAAARS